LFLRVAHFGEFVRLSATVKGRPKKNRLEPVWVEKRKRWKVEIPASWYGKRQTSFFEGETAARIWINDREEEKLKGLPMADDHRGENDARSISSLRSTYLKEREKTAGHDLLKNHLAKLCAEFGGLPLSDVGAHAAKRWIAALPYAERTRWGIYATCRSFGRWAVRYRYSEKNPFDAMEPPTKGDPPKVILAPEQMATLLNWGEILKKHKIAVPHYMRAWMALGGFAGLRTEEILRMEWDKKWFEEGEIHVPATAIKKTRGGMRERYVTMLPAFLDLCPSEREGRIIPVSRTVFHYHAQRIAEAVLGLPEWPHNALRHSFASYHLAMWEDAGKTAFQMGHTSSAMVHQNYARAVRKVDAVQWWNLRRL
jgi:integrase